MVVQRRMAAVNWNLETLSFELNGRDVEAVELRSMMKLIVSVPAGLSSDEYIETEVDDAKGFSALGS